MNRLSHAFEEPMIKLSHHTPKGDGHSESMTTSFSSETGADGITH